ncbi:hypothetical protein Thein_1944 [Thermodesulfatator indicus DSM 15286]|uniref:Uncharacterized protein n=1 Tax=Thermodesulfatator indicus (strain DSM 15286 / JCM 11887 / CIR29812) TaxID=667014 RepID=F8ACM4_THEID|nr:hypothetical protein [Thermodesulfatator indicus]AEH45799.1 hypothetical protein Thein_1944 [Thermodesulfatator indicus DSM 15286]
MLGKIKYYYSKKEYGVIVGEDKIDRFFNIGDIIMGVPEKDAKVIFKPKKGRNHPRASNVKIIGKIYCRGTSTRKKVIKEYNLKPVAHVRLLYGQKKISCTGHILTDRYYCFWFKNRQNFEDNGYFFCGYDAAEQFLDLLQLPHLPIFDPLKSPKKPPSSDNKNESREKIDMKDGRKAGDTNKIENPIAKQLYDAFHLLIICADIIPKTDSPLANIKKEIERNLYKELANEVMKELDKSIKGLNTIISKILKTPLQQKIQELREKGNDIKEYKFDLLNERLKAKGVQKSFFG